MRSRCWRSHPADLRYRDVQRSDLSKRLRGRGHDLTMHCSISGPENVMQNGAHPATSKHERLAGRQRSPWRSSSHRRFYRRMELFVVIAPRTACSSRIAAGVLLCRAQSRFWMKFHRSNCEHRGHSSLDCDASRRPRLCRSKALPPLIHPR